MRIITDSDATRGNDVATGNPGSANGFLGYGWGADIVTGGNLNDIFVMTYDRFLDVVDGGEGTDTVDYSYGYTPLLINLAEGTTHVNLEGVGPLFGTVTSLTGIENVVGTRFDDVIIGDGEDNTIEGGGGADVINGGAGNDTASYEYSTEGVTVDLSGTPGLGGLLGRTGRGSGGDAEGDLLIGIENVTGSSHDDVFMGNGADNIFDGGDGVDRVSYRHTSQGVHIDLREGVVEGASVGTDWLRNIEQVEGTRFDDSYVASQHADVFVFGSDIGHDTIDRFDARNSRDSQDLINFKGMFESWEDLQDNISRDGNAWTITIDDHNSITLTHVQGTLDASDFLFG
jgi:Ca2+-binding RTX toxin-like protein